MLRFKIVKFLTETIRSIFPIFCFLTSKISCEQNTSWRFKFTIHQFDLLGERLKQKRQTGYTDTIKGA